MTMAKKKITLQILLLLKKNRDIQKMNTPIVFYNTEKSTLD